MVGILIVSHGRLSEALISSVQFVIGNLQKIKGISIWPKDTKEEGSKETFQHPCREGFSESKSSFHSMVALIGELKGDPYGPYAELSSGFRNRMEVVVGNKVRVIVDSVIDKNGNILREIKKEIICEVNGYWNELHIPLKEVSEYDLKRGDILKLIMRSVIQFGVEGMA